MQSSHTTVFLGFKKLGEMSNGASNFHKQTQQGKQVVGQVPPNNHVQTPVTQVVETKMVPIQITLPAQPGSDLGQRVLTIQVPASALQGNQLHKVLTGPVISATMSLPQNIANNLLQQHVNAAFGSVAIGSIVNKPVIQGDSAFLIHDSEGTDTPSVSLAARTGTMAGPSTTAGPSMTEGPRQKRRKLGDRIVTIQVDGSNDTSDDDDDASEDDDGSDDGDDDKDEDEQEMEDAGPEEEPLNSEDDVSDEDPTDLFDTENVVVCQYDKVSIG